MGVWKYAVLVIGIWAACQAAFTAGMLRLERHRDFCIACHLHQAKHARMLQPPRRVGELSAVHHAEGIGCADCHRELFPDVTPAQRLEPATGELSRMRARLREKGVRID